MARRRSPTLTEAETRLMNVLWAKHRATVADVVGAMPRQHAVAYNTIQTLLRILEQKGYVAHEVVGRAFVYRASLKQDAARRHALGHLMKAMFDDSPSLLVRNVLEDERIDPAERERVRRLIGEA
jgi:predicted transcriptional regulator